MAEMETDELMQADEAFAGNRLLSTFNAEARGLIEPLAKWSNSSRAKSSSIAAIRFWRACFRWDRR